MTEGTLPSTQFPGGTVLSTNTDHAATANMTASSALTTSSAIGTAKLIVYYPIVLTTPMSVALLFWVNGTTVAGNVQLGVFSDSMALLGNNGTTTAQSGTSAVQSVAPSSALFLPAPARYYLALTSDDATSTFFSSSSVAFATGTMGGLGVMTETTGTFGLANAGSQAVSTFETVFLCGISRSATL